MIKSFRHKGLKLLYDEDDPRKLNAEHIRRLKLILTTLDAVGTVEENMSPSDFPAVLRLHQLKGNLQGFWAVTVQANWRVIFRFADGHIYDVDLVDYH
jgi:toxin HigB-1